MLQNWLNFLQSLPSLPSLQALPHYVSVASCLLWHPRVDMSLPGWPQCSCFITEHTRYNFIPCICGINTPALGTQNSSHQTRLPHLRVTTVYFSCFWISCHQKHLLKPFNLKKDLTMRKELSQTVFCFVCCWFGFSMFLLFCSFGTAAARWAWRQAQVRTTVRFSWLEDSQNCTLSSGWV